MSLGFSLFGPPQLRANPYYKIYYSINGAPFGPANDATDMFQKRIVSLTITRRKSTAGSNSPLAEATINLREPLDSSFFAGLPGSGLDKELRKGLQSIRWAIEVGYNNIDPADLIGTGCFYKKNSYLPDDKAVDDVLVLMQPKAVVFIGKMLMPNLSGNPKGEFSTTIRLVDTVSTANNLYDPLSRENAKANKLNEALVNEVKIKKNQSDYFIAPPRPFIVDPKAGATGPAAVSPLGLFKEIFDSLFGVPVVLNSEKRAKFKLNMEALVDPRFLVHDLTKASIRRGWSFVSMQQNRYNFFKKVLEEYLVDMFLRFDDDGVIELVLYPKGQESLVYFRPVDKAFGIAPPGGPLPFAINAIYGINVNQFEFTADASGPVSGASSVVTATVKDKKGMTKEVTFSFSQDKANKWVTARRKENIAKGISDDFINRSRVDKDIFELQQNAANSEEGQQKLLDAWYEPQEAIKDPLSASKPDVPKLGQNLKLKFRYAIPGFVPGMQVNFEGVPIKSQPASLLGITSSVGFGGVAKPARSVPDGLSGRFISNEITFSFSASQNFTMDVGCSR